MLDQRSRRVLLAVIECYITTMGPVGSRVVTKKYTFGLSPATIRNIMSDLEELGYLRQPHTSAGRVPTDRGYRFYVEEMKDDRRQIEQDLRHELRVKFDPGKEDINTVLDDASKMLSAMSHYIGITTSPGAAKTVLHKIELIKFRGDQLAVILFTDEGLIKNRVIRIDPEIPQKHLNRLAEYINSEFSGRTIDEIRKTVITELNKEAVACDRLISDAMKICKDVFSVTSGTVYVSGLSEMLMLPDFCDIERIKELLKTIEDKHIIVKLLDRIADAEGTQVFIGSENEHDEMKKFSLVAAPYREGSRPVGTIGIIGPTRMDYLRAISIVDLTAAYLTKILSYR